MAAVYCKDIICPFYKTLWGETDEEKKKIKKEIGCEGICGAKITVLDFSSEKKRNIFADSRCRSYNYKKCSVAQALAAEKYGGEI